VAYQRDLVAQLDGVCGVAIEENSGKARVSIGGSGGESERLK
jgi:hypothetical protein